MDYVELHCHSNFSFLDGASHPEELIDRAHELGYRAMALTDHDGLYGLVRFDQAAKEKKIKPLFGAEMTVCDRPDDNTTPRYHLVLLVMDPKGYANLSQLCTAAGRSREKGKACATPAMLDRYREGLIALSGCPRGELPQAVLDNDYKRAETVAARYRELYGADNYYLELQHHNLPWHHVLCDHLIALARRLRLPTVATNNVHYATADRRRLQDVLTCVKHHTTLDAAGSLLYPNAERLLKPREAMIARFRHCPEAIAHTVEIAERCWFRMDQLTTSLPDFPVPEGYNSRSYLRHLTYLGAQNRYGDLSRTVIDQVEHELRIISRLDLAGYFLIVWDVTRFCNERGILCQGRGSAANSAVCYCLGITAVDPIGLKLLFERFLSEQRTEPPDIDIDIAHNRREEAIQYVYEKYGRDHAAMVCEIISYKGRSAVRDVGKALGFSLEEVDVLAKLHDHFSRGEETSERVEEAGFNPNDRRVELLIELCRQIYRFPRHVGIHVGGMIVTKRPLSEIVPIENATMPLRSVIQWDKDDVGAMSLIKIDLLGLGMLSLIDIAFRLIRDLHGLELNMAKMNYEDPNVYRFISSAETVGIFQIESRAQMNTLPRHRPERFYDLVVEVALIRPGPIQGGMVHPYLRRRNGEEPVTYPHPSLKPILERTLGIPLFQEQGMQVAMAAAGFTPSQADEVRRAMGHKRSAEKMEALRARLVMGMVKNGIDEESALRIFKQLAAFADFGFAESHAASFALLVYVSSWLKLYYPVEFYCALLNAQPLGFYSPSTILYEARGRGVHILSVDIKNSQWDCTVEDGKVRLGFRYIKSMGDKVKEQLEVELQKGAFTSPSDFVFRTGLEHNHLERLALVGAFSGFGLGRREALWELLALANESEGRLELTTPETGASLLAPMATTEEVVADFKGMDLSPGPHPIEFIRDWLNTRQILSAKGLRDCANGRTVQVAGMVIIRQRPMTAKGFMFVTLEDETGFANIVVKPNYVKSCRKAIIYSKGLVVKGQVEHANGVTNLIGREFTPLRISKTDINVKTRDFR
jgi:error-prone DNA polymerase